jgi:uroporphyrin-III C-methyltransferase/precorrin-2 dehydrogenase/sirohydrochlorin ferrochelatase
MDQLPIFSAGSADSSAQAAAGEVYLVGAGPGDPDLLTLRALRLMQQADVVVHDNLVSDEVMDLVRCDAERIHVGKACGNHTLPQEEINALLVRLALDGRRVLRLKGGDPFIFGRGGEEIDMLAAHGIPFQVVPGISAANGVSSYTGIPLTHRDHAQSVLFATGHLRDGTVNLDWTALTRPHQTVVIYMGLGGLAEICRQLIAHGLPPAMPAAVVQQGTTRHQRVVAGTLATLPALVAAARLKSPSLTIVGEVVGLRAKLAWFVPARDAEPQLNVQQPSD